MLRLITTCAATAVCLLVGIVQSANAEWELSLSSDSDLRALTVGEIVTFDVVLSGLQPGEERISYFSSVEYDSALLEPETISPGPILPDPNWLTSDFPSGVPGLFGVFYDSEFTPSGERISSNGVFYSFQMAVIGVGSGELIVYGGGVADDQLAFTVVPAAVIPAPSSLLLFGMGLVALLGCMRLRRNRPPAE